MEDFGDVHGGQGGQIAKAPGESPIFTVIDWRKVAQDRDLSAPSANVPGVSFDIFRTVLMFVRVTELHFDAEKIVVHSAMLVEGDDVRVGSEGFEEALDVILGNPIIIVDEGDVFTSSGAEQGVAFLTYGTALVVDQHEVFHGKRTDLRGEVFAELGDLSESRGDCGCENGED
jgi:hypothetical protein